jgi:pyruvate,water dikinase
MEKLLGYISPLHLVDPQAESFAPEGCKSFHDILRFAHEKGVHEMFSLGDKGGRRARGAKRLTSAIPISMYLLDLGGGLSEEAGMKKEVDVDEVTCIPLQAVWRGLSHPEIYWDSRVRHCDWKELDRLSAGIMSRDSRLLASYAILSRDYLNLNIHFGYHFVVVDALCGREFKNNYMMLRFAGGGAGAHSRLLRVAFLERVLSHFGFKVEKTGDLIDAQLTRQDRRTLEKNLEMLGQLLGASRLLDMALTDGAQVDEMVEKFLDGHYDLSPLGRNRP